MKKITAVLLTIIALIVFGGSCFVGMKLYSKYSEGTEWADLTEYFELSTSGEGAVMLDSTILDAKCRILNGICYLDLDTVQQYLHNRFYYTELSRELRYTDAVMIVTVPLDGGTWSSVTEGQTSSFEEPYVIALTIDGTCYVALDFVEKYVPVKHAVYSEPDRVVIDTMEMSREMVTVKKETDVRYRAGVKSGILAKVPKGGQVVLLDAEEVEGWLKVATQDGFVGYMKESRAGAREEVSGTNTLSYVQPEYTGIALDEKLRLGFQAVYNMSANSNLASVLETAYNINVVAPTWFAVCDSAGNFTSLASESYVQTAHERGIQVWALVEDITNDVDMYALLADSVSRTNLIEGLVREALAYDLDGLNIDFEGIRQREGEHFIQFLRELSIRCREEGLILSVDNYPPNQGNLYYDYEEQGIIADYVILMGYDEHWGGCGEPGSSASQPFVENSIDNLLKMVPKDKLVNALPFYTRLWKTSGDTVTDKAIYMKAIGTAVEEYGMVVDYDDAAGQKYAKAETADGVYEMWIEDLASIEKKLLAVCERDLAGVAAWRLGYEEQAVWELIGGYIQ